MTDDEPRWYVDAEKSGREWVQSIRDLTTEDDRRADLRRFEQQMKAGAVDAEVLVKAFRAMQEAFAPVIAQLRAIERAIPLDEEFAAAMRPYKYAQHYGPHRSPGGPVPPPIKVGSPRVAGWVDEWETYEPPLFPARFTAKIPGTWRLVDEEPEPLSTRSSSIIRRPFRLVGTPGPAPIREDVRTAVRAALDRIDLTGPRVTRGLDSTHRTMAEFLAGRS